MASWPSLEKVGNMEYNVTMDCADAKALIQVAGLSWLSNQTYLLERGLN